MTYILTDTDRAIIAELLSNAAYMMKRHGNTQFMLDGTPAEREVATLAHMYSGETGDPFYENEADEIRGSSICTDNYLLARYYADLLKLV